MERDAELWNTYLHISGGALEHQKCFWYLMNQEWNENNRKYLSSKEKLEEAGAVVHVSVTGSDRKEKIQLKDCSESHKTLGAWKNIDGSCKAQLEKIREKSEIFGANIAKASLTMLESRMAADRMLIPSLEFALATASLTRAECFSAHSPGLIPCIRKAGFASTTARAIIHGPLELGGANFTSLYAAQISSQVSLLQHHLRVKGNVGDLIRINLGWMQLIAGTKNPILSDCTTELPHLDQNWIMSIRQGLNDCGGRMEIYNCPDFGILRENDVHIMDKALNTKFRRPGDLRDVNYCRLYCGVITLADACTADGRRLAQDVYRCSTRNF